MLENGQINSCTSHKKINLATTPRPGVYELKDINIDKKVIRVIKKRTRDAFRQTLVGKEKLKSSGVYKVASPLPAKNTNKKTNRKSVTIRSRLQANFGQPNNSVIPKNQNIQELLFDSLNGKKSLKTTKT